MDIQSPTLQQIHTEICEGKIVLPDFQRDFVWKSDDIQDLLVSILANYYIGTMLFIEELKQNAPFKVRLVSGVPEKMNPPDSRIVKILLDGQQRCSSLYYALSCPEIPISGRKQPVKFACSIPSTLKQEWDNSVIVATNNKQEAAIAKDPNYIFFHEFLNTGDIVTKISASPLKTELPKIVNVINGFNQFKFQMAELPRGTSLDRVVDIFERINRTGLPLSVTDLLVAKLFKGGIDLRSKIEQARDNFSFMDDENGIEPEFILRLIVLMRGQDIRKKTILDINVENFDEDWNKACLLLEQAFRRIVSTGAGYGAISFRRFMPFKTMIIPLAAMLGFLMDRKLENDANFRKVDEWYWISVFRNRYNEAVNTNTFSDFEKMKKWILDGIVPDIVSDFSTNQIDFLVTAKTSSVYRGVLCLILKAGAKDFKTGNSPEMVADKLQDDHIFPKSIYGDDIILNRTLISTNSEKSNKPPKEYFSALETLNGTARLEEILRSHLVDSDCLESIKVGSLAEFKKRREANLRREIAKITPNGRHELV